MSFNIINKLRGGSPVERGEILENTYSRNRAFFKKNYPVINEYLNQSSSPYRIDMTESFLNIVDERNGTIAHPDNLDTFAEMLGGWTHQGWQELFNLKVMYPSEEGVHKKCVRSLFQKLGENFPEHKEYWERGQLNLKELSDGRRFSPPVVFLGIFHGLHIAHHFSNTLFTDALFLEPDHEKFEVSCYFLDYEAVVERVGTFHIYVGEEALGRHFARFFDDYMVTPHQWVRVLPAYASEKMPYFVEVMKALQSTRSDTMYPHDHHLYGLQNACKNINKKLPLLCRQPKLSKKSCIAVIAAGPSLTHDLKWLKKNQERVLIFAVHSSVKILKEHGIVPDLQFSLDTKLDTETIDKLDLYEDVPLVNDYKTEEKVYERMQEVLLVSDRNASHAVKIESPLQHSTPSSANLAFSFACYCRPLKILLLGCDMGYRSMDEIHVKGHHDDEGGDTREIYEGSRQMLTPPNFSELAPVQTTPFLNSTRMSMEAILQNTRGAITVYNLSDGSKIDGTIAKYSSTLKLPLYKKKQYDIQKIRDCFLPLAKNVNWRPFATSGEEVLEGLKKELLKNLKLEDFNWYEFCQHLDLALFAAMESVDQKMAHDYRMAIYNKVILDLLCGWFIYIIFRDDMEETEKIYAKGYEIVKEALNYLHWPADVEPN